jgi:hypothetical protein
VSLEASYVFSSLFTIHFLRSGASSSENSILVMTVKPDSGSPKAICYEVQRIIAVVERRLTKTWISRVCFTKLHAVTCGGERCRTALDFPESTFSKYIHHKCSSFVIVHSKMTASDTAILRFLDNKSDSLRLYSSSQTSGIDALCSFVPLFCAPPCSAQVRTCTSLFTPFASSLRNAVGKSYISLYLGR